MKKISKGIAMTRRHTFIFIIFTLATIHIGVVGSVSAALVSHYKFDGNTQNEVSGVSNGVAVNSPSYTYGYDGKPNGAIVFNGVNQFVDTSTSGLPNSGTGLSKGSVSFWLKSDDDSHTTGTIMGTLNSNDWTAFIVQLNDVTTPDDIFRIYVRDKNCMVLSEYNSSVDSRWRNDIWHHYAFVWDCAVNKVEIYVDGDAYTLTTQTAQTPSEFTPWQYGMIIGAMNNRGAIENHFCGAVDDFRVYDVDLTAEEVAQLSNKAAGAAVSLTRGWVATDALGRELPDFYECGQVRNDKYVGIFYFALHHNYLQYQAWNTTQILAANPTNPQWGPEGQPHWWDEPEIGYYSSDDPWVIRRHLAMLANAGVDVLIIDTTNQKTYPEIYMPICVAARQMRSQGYSVPKLTFATYHGNDGTGPRPDRIKQLYDEFYSKNYYPDMWFCWQGKPLLLGYPDEQLANGTYLSSTIKNFFTFRECWSQQTGENRWPWVDTSPQDYGWHLAGRPEHMPVQVASHPCQLNIGRSYHDGTQPSLDQYDLTGDEHLGLNFDEQWERAFQFDPNFVFITGWNEWEQGRFVYNPNWGYVEFLGQPLQDGETFFSDLYNREYSRDSEPMKDGFTDNYYHQLASNIRLFKGAPEPETTSEAQTIQVDGAFSEWSSVRPVFKDLRGDTLHRSFAGRGGNYYTNYTGRNDFVTLKVAYDSTHIYFYAETTETITNYTDSNWMLLFIDSDQNNASGWEGYDYLLNLTVNSSTSTTLEVSSGSWDWAAVNNDISYRASGNQIELMVPRSDIDQGLGEQTVAFDFHWADNIQAYDDIIEFAISGDSAPDRKFNYRYDSSFAESACQQLCGAGGGLAADWNQDCQIDCDDLVLLAEDWLSVADLTDFADLAGEWMVNYTPEYLSETVLLEDDFEGGLGQWSTDWILNTDEAFSGSYSAKAKTGVHNIASGYLNSEDYQTMKMSFKYMIKGGMSSDMITLDFYNGSTWIPIDALGSQDEDVWLYYNTTIYNEGSDSQFFRTNLRVKLDGSGLPLYQYFYVDDVLVTVVK